MKWRILLDIYWVKFLGLFGHCEWEHPFKTCPTGDRHCMHYHYKLGRK